MHAELKITEQGSSVQVQCKHEFNKLLLLSRASKIQKKDEIAVEQPKCCTINYILCFLPICTDWGFYTPGKQQQKTGTFFLLWRWWGGKGMHLYNVIFMTKHTHLLTPGAQFASPGLHLLNLKRMWQNYSTESPLPQHVTSVIRVVAQWLLFLSLSRQRIVHRLFLAGESPLSACVRKS